MLQPGDVSAWNENTIVQRDIQCGKLEEVIFQTQMDKMMQEGNELSLMKLRQLQLRKDTNKALPDNLGPNNLTKVSQLTKIVVNN